MAFNPDFLPTVSVSRMVLEADVLISLPKFKTHGLTVITGAIKNSYGILPGAQKAKLHQAAGSPDRFHEAVVEVFRLRVPDLFILDAVVGMEGNGPASPDLREIGLILASDNAVALDSVMAFMVGCDPGRLRFPAEGPGNGPGGLRPGTGSKSWESWNGCPISGFPLWGAKRSAATKTSRPLSTGKPSCARRPIPSCAPAAAPAWNSARYPR